MGLYTADDLVSVKAALIRIASEGVASANVAGQAYVFHDIEKLENFARRIQSDLAADLPGGGIRRQRITPYYP